MSNIFQDNGQLIEQRKSIVQIKDEAETGYNFGDSYSAILKARYGLPIETGIANLLGGAYVKQKDGENRWVDFPPYKEENFSQSEYVKENYPEYLNNTQVWIHGNNGPHIDWYINQYERAVRYRAKRNKMSFGSRMLGEIGDPVYLFAPLRIAFGPSSFVTNTLKSGGLIGGIQTPQLIADPTYSPLEYASDIAFGGLAFATIGKTVNAVKGGVIRKQLNNANQIAKKQYDEIQGIDKTTLLDKKNRPLHKLTDEDLIKNRTKAVNELVNDGKISNSNKLDKIDKEIAIRKVEGNENQFDIPNTLFTDSFLYNMVSTPLKRLARSGNTIAQDLGFSIAYDSGVLLKAHQMGKKLKQSVFQLIKLHDGHLKTQTDNLFRFWGEDKVGGSTKFLDVEITPIVDKLTFNKNTFNNWLDEVSRAYITRSDPTLLTAPQRKALKVMDDFFNDWKIKLTETGQIKTLKSAGDDVTRIANRITQIKKYKNEKLTNKQKNRLLDEIDNLEIKLEKAEKTLKIMKNTKTDIKYPVQLDDVFFPRFWDRNAISKDPDKFADIIRTHLLENPNYNPKQISKIVKKENRKQDFDRGPTTENNVDARVKAIVKSILNQEFAEDYFGHGVGKHLNRRIIDVPNFKVYDYIETNPISVMRAYVNKTASIYEFKKMYNNQGFDEIRNNTRFDMEMQGIPTKEINKNMRDIEHLYDAVTENVLRNPSAINHKIVMIMKDIAQLNYLGMSGITTIVEPAKIIMEHGLRPTVKALISVIDDPLHWQSRFEVQKGGEALDIAKGQIANRISDGIKTSHIPTIWDKTKSSFYILNGLSWATQMLKYFDGIIRQHSLIEMSIKWSNGTASKMEQEYLLRYGINQNDALNIATMPYQKSKNDFYMANTDAWNDAAIKSTFQTALSGGVLNTILMGTPADKPIVMSGIFYVPMNVANKFGMKEDPIVKGYARIENSLLSLPFQFYSYMLASVNKTAAGYATGQMKGKTTGVLASIGLGYMLLRLKTSDYTYDKMTDRDKFFRAFDYGGLTSLHNDMFFTALHTVSELGGGNITGGLISPKYNTSNATIPETIVGLAGAGPSITYDLLDGLKDFLSGNYTKGAQTWVKNAPFARTWFGNDIADEMTRVLGGRY